MAESSVLFFATSKVKEEIENAKRFWKVIDPPVETKSTLTVLGIHQRLPTALSPGVVVPQTQHDVLKSLYDESKLEPFLKEAARRKAKSEEEYLERFYFIKWKNRIFVQKTTPICVVHQRIHWTLSTEEMKNETQELLKKQRNERIKQEEISKKVIVNQVDPVIAIIDLEEETVNEKEAQEAMAELDAFEERLKSR